MRTPISWLRVRLGRRRLERGTHPLPPLRSSFAADHPLEQGWFVNPFAEGADPYVVRDGSSYLWCQTVADQGISVSRSDRLHSRGEHRVVWTAPESGPWSREVWAPELIQIDGRWHIYFAASDGDNANHLTYVLVADTDDPQGSYTLAGPLDTGDIAGRPEWAIDMTVLEHYGTRYALWSGWPGDHARVQHLYIAPMATPTQLAAPRTMLTTPYDYPWERISDDGPDAINEAPQVLKRDGRTFVVFSCGSALLPSYKLGLLELVGSDPVDPASWHKKSEPIFASTADTFGVGHGTFVPSPDDSQMWLVYHRKIVRDRNFKRVLHAQPISFSDEGLPVLGDPVAAGVPLKVVSGTPQQIRDTPEIWSFDGTESNPISKDFDYYGHQQFQTLAADGLHLGKVPAEPVNAFRSGEKLVLRDGLYTDVRLCADLDIVDGHGSAGVLFRCTAPAVGVDSQRGYFAAWIKQHRRLVLGYTDGSSWTPLAATQVDHDGPVRLVAEAVGDQLRAQLDGLATVTARDDRYPFGSVGMRVAHAHALFTSLTVEPFDGSTDGPVVT